MGVPVVASNVSGIPELIAAERNGVLVAPDNAVVLADAITRLLGAPARGAALAREARGTVVEYFDNDRNLRLLCELLRTHGGAGVAARAASEPANTPACHLPLGVK